MRLGAKASPRDVAEMRVLPHVRFVETVLFGDDLRDLDATARAYEAVDEVIVHVPFTTPEGDDLDVAAADPRLRAASYAAWADAMRLADRLDARWVVLHPGGIVPEELADGPEAGAARADAMDHLEAALVRLGEEHGRDRILLENMPSHYHRNTGTTDRSLLGQGVVDLEAWRDLVGGFCLDVSHAWLTPGAAKNLDMLFSRLGLHIRHLHLSDARAPDHEGLQVGDGEVPWVAVRDHVRALEAEHGERTGVPEVKGGHADGGAGFRFALDFLATHLG